MNPVGGLSSGPFHLQHDGLFCHSIPSGYSGPEGRVQESKLSCFFPLPNNLGEKKSGMDENIENHLIGLSLGISWDVTLFLFYYVNQTRPKNLFKVQTCVIDLYFRLCNTRHNTNALMPPIHCPT